MRELVDKRLMLEDVKSWVAMDSYEQHLINNMSEWIENLPTVEVSDGDCISRRAALDALKRISFSHWFECGEYLSEDTREIEIINSKKALEVIEALPSAQPEPSEITDEQAILHLQSTGWMQNHDREIYESGLKERLADDSESYDSLIPYEDDGDTISRRAAVDVVDFECGEWRGLAKTITDKLEALPTVQPERVWHSCKTPPKHHKDVLVRGTEAIGNVTTYKVMQWDVDAWRPTDYAPSIIWEEWSEIYE